MKKLFFTLIMLGLFICASAAEGADLSSARSEYVIMIAPYVLTLKKITGLKDPVSKIYVGNVDIADVYPASPDSFIFQGKKEGLTNVIMIGNNEETVFSARIAVSTGIAPVRIFHGIDHVKEFACNPSNCDPLGGAAGR